MNDPLIVGVPVSLDVLTGGGPGVILAPHPDDETLGCGGLLAALFSNAASSGSCLRPAHVICMTDGSRSHPGSRSYPADKLAQTRREEMICAVRYLGGTEDDVSFLNYPDGWLGVQDLADTAAAVVGICDRVGASALFSTSPVDTHEDHKSTARIAGKVHAARPHLRHWIYPIWSRWDDPEFVAAHSPAIARSFDTRMWQHAKARAIHAHASQMGRLVVDDLSGFAMESEFVKHFVQQPELFFEGSPCP